MVQYLQVLEVDNAIRSVLVRRSREGERCLELSVPAHSIDQTVIEVQKHRSIMLFNRRIIPTDTQKQTNAWLTRRVGGEISTSTTTSTTSRR